MLIEACCVGVRRCQYRNTDDSVDGWFGRRLSSGSNQPHLGTRPLSVPNILSRSSLQAVLVFLAYKQRLTLDHALLNPYPLAIAIPFAKTTTLAMALNPQMYVSSGGADDSSSLT